MCIFCQTQNAKAKLSNSTKHGITTVKEAVCARHKLRDSKYIEVINRVENALNSDTVIPLVWLRTCYPHFTDKSKIGRLHKAQMEHLSEEASRATEVAASNRCSLRKGAQPVDWSLCIFCQSSNKKVRLTSVMTKQMSDQIIQASHLDYKAGFRLAGVIDLIAAEAKYHLPCLSACNRSTSKTKQESANTDLAMIWLCQELHQAVEKGNVILLDTAWNRYKELAEESPTTLRHYMKVEEQLSRKSCSHNLGTLSISSNHLIGA